MKMPLLMLSLLFFLPLKAGTFFMPDSDTALLFQLVTNTASQLNELEHLISNTEKYTKHLRKYNELAEDHFFRAQRLTYLVDEMKTLSDLHPKDLEQLNNGIRNVKSQMDSLKGLISEYKIKETNNNALEKATLHNDAQIKKDQTLSFIQIKRSEHLKTLKASSKLSAQNTALMNKNIVDLKNQNNQILNKLIEANNIQLNKEKTRLTKEKQNLRYLNGNSK